MWPLLFVALLLVPVAELWVIVQAADRIGLAPTLALLIVISIAGASLLRQQGLAAWHRLQEALRRGELPSAEMSDGVLIVIGGAFLLTPGFLTDAVGLLLLVPPTRAAVKGVARRLLARWARRRLYVGAGGPRVYSAEVRNARREDPPRSPLPRRRGEDGSRDTG
jgi:UPF0716 protein FxsA